MKKEILEKLTAAPGKKHSVGDFDTAYNAGMSKKEAEEKLQETVGKIGSLQNKLYAQDKNSILIVFQAMDAAGKDGTIKHVFTGVNPAGCQVYSFKQPSYEELEHGFLWRVFKNLPEKGRIGIFNRSHYEEVVITKVHPELILKQRPVGIEKHTDIGAAFWRTRYRQINDFERYLTENGVVVLKFFLNVSRHEQSKRFLERLQDETANWKFSLSDVEESSFWDDYMAAYSDMLTHTSTRHAPWYVIPADNKWFMRGVVASIICERMKELNLEYPELTDMRKKDIKKVVAAIKRRLSEKS